jgi:hypothetical protein
LSAEASNSPGASGPAVGHPAAIRTGSRPRDEKHDQQDEEQPAAEREKVKAPEKWEKAAVHGELLSDFLSASNAAAPVSAKAPRSHQIRQRDWTRTNSMDPASSC